MHDAVRTDASVSVEESDCGLRLNSVADTVARPTEWRCHLLQQEYVLMIVFHAIICSPLSSMDITSASHGRTPYKPRTTVVPVG
jgi:hypothetical protein